MNKKPVVINFIAILQGIIIIFYFVKFSVIGGIEINIFFFNSIILVHILSASFGLLRGKEWGWWLTNIYYINIFIGLIVSKVKLFDFVSKMDEGTSVEFITFFSPLAGLTLIIAIFVPLYLFRKNTLIYFNINHSRLKFLLIVLISVIWNIFVDILH